MLSIVQIHIQKYQLTSANANILTYLFSCVSVWSELFSCITMLYHSSVLVLACISTKVPGQIRCVIAVLEKSKSYSLRIVVCLVNIAIFLPFHLPIHLFPFDEFIRAPLETYFLPSTLIHCLLAKSSDLLRG